MSLILMSFKRTGDIVMPGITVVAGGGGLAVPSWTVSRGTSAGVIAAGIAPHWPTAEVSRAEIGRLGPLV